ncbi:unnamed protein product [Rhizoctonia solani]|uniref:Uncharacterized protein n=1 Tax=Rhizoctonia solani TaxID=456999 RepID=A0A8H2WNL2_9AGAM|nr:unnamed protein product [Rhizoctonia solani]CAE6455784.1 unnamed protein product [Rhizoctonia solani]
MSVPGFAALASPRYRLFQIPRKPFTGLYYIRKHSYVPKAAPLVVVTLCSLSMGMYLSLGNIRNDNVQWKPHAKLWLQTSTGRAHWYGAGGVRETIQKELRK